MADSVGQILKNTRLQSNKSLEDASIATHIRIQYLEALENDQRELLPSEVQARGFLRLYADYLNIPQDYILAVWAGTPLPLIISNETESSPEIVEPVADIVEEPDPLQEPIPETISEPFDTTIPSIIDPSLSESQVIYCEIGAELRKQREALGLSLAEVENYTHIRQHYLESIENGRMNHLPSPVQGRGMLNNYAKFLQLDVEKIKLRYADGLQSGRLERLKEHPVQVNSKKRVKSSQRKIIFRRFLTPDLLVGGFLVILLFSITIWSLSQVFTPSQTTQKATAPSISNVLLVTSSPTYSTPAQNIITESGFDATELPPTQSIPMDDTDLTIQNTLPPSTGGEKALNIQVIASQHAWVRIIADKKEVFNKRVTPGNIYQFSASDQIQLTSGNAGAIQVIFNQQDLGILGIVGQIVNITFSQDGIQTPTIPPTMTPTPTQEFTATPTGPTPTQITPSITPFIP